MDTKPIVNWQSPETVPNVPKDETETFWVAVKRKTQTGWRKFVFDAQYVNKPLEFEEDDTEKQFPLSDDYFVDEDGQPTECVGWFSLREHADFSGYYEPLTFNSEYILLGWGKYQTPEFNEAI